MINPKKSFNIYDYIEIAYRRIWYIIIPFIIIIMGTIVYLLIVPKLYRASTLILVTPQKVPEAFIKATVSSKIEDRLQSIAQEIMSRTRIENIITEFNLYSEDRKSRNLEELVERVRNNIKVDIKGKEGYFTISYTGREPKIVAAVTNKLASMFIEENLKLRELQAQGTSEFLSSELKTTKERLENQERSITEFKRRYMGELPEQRDANLKVLEQLQLNYQRIGESIRAAQDRKVILQKQLSDIELIITASAKKDEFGESQIFPLQMGLPVRNQTKSQSEVKLEQLKRELLELQSKYKEKHPDIILTKKKIKELEAKIGTSGSEKVDSEELKDEVLSSKSGTKMIDETDVKLNPRYKEIESQIVATQLEIERLREEESKVKAQINKYRERIETTPLRELTLAQLTRDYQNTKEIYESLLKKNEEAQQAENLERRQKGEQFKVVDPARVPERPFKPDVPKVLLMGFILACGGGFALAFIREQMDRSFRDAEDLEATFGIKVLANIPRIEKKAA